MLYNPYASTLEPDQQGLVPMLSALTKRWDLIGKVKPMVIESGVGPLNAWQGLFVTPESVWLHDIATLMVHGAQHPGILLPWGNGQTYSSDGVWGPVGPDMSDRGVNAAKARIRSVQAVVYAAPDGSHHLTCYSELDRAAREIPTAVSQLGYLQVVASCHLPASPGPLSRFILSPAETHYVRMVREMFHANSNSDVGKFGEPRQSFVQQFALRVEFELAQALRSIHGQLPPLPKPDWLM